MRKRNTQRGEGSENVFHGSLGRRGGSKITGEHRSLQYNPTDKTVGKKEGKASKRRAERERTRGGVGRSKVLVSHRKEKRSKDVKRGGGSKIIAFS